MPQPQRSSNETDDPPASERVQLAVTDAAERRDVHLYAWTVAAGIITGEIRRDLAAVAVSATRALVALPAQDTDRELALCEAAAIGAMLHGIPPRDEAQWEKLRELFDEPTLEQLAAEKPLDGWFTLIGGGRQPRG